jgi:predicted pyridoxine 5'-phosphate oxidase superfamily flavin-nucleotide-binding protein
MAVINDEMKKVLEETRLWVLATADSDGMPNAVPIRWTKILANDTLMLVDNFMKKSVDNIAVNPRVAISVWKDSTGYQFKGTASIETSGLNFENGKKMVLEGNPKLNPKGVVILRVDSIFSTSPGTGAGKKLV